MDIIFATSELAPFAKTGGLGDMAASLPKSLADMGVNCYIFVPKYKDINETAFGLTRSNKQITVPLSNRLTDGEIYETSISERLHVYFISNEEFFHRDGIYESNGVEHHDNAERFTFFSRGCLLAIKALHLQPDIIHCHDWPTGLIPVYLRTIYKDDNYFRNIKTVFTVHNVVYQGVYAASHLDMMGLQYDDVFNPDGIEYHKKINLLKGGIVFSDILTTVSRTYAREIQTAEFGNGMEGLLQHRSSALYGIMNGVDYDTWNPAIDKYIAKQFSVNNISGKQDCKRELLSICGFDYREETPLIGVISRLDGQKGIDLLERAMRHLAGMDIHLCLLGIGEQRYHKIFRDIAGQYSDKISVTIAFDNQLAHKIEAGADIFLMPSRYEPCGLNQMYSLKYGTIPVVRDVGGLSDSIDEYDPVSKSGHGFKFHEYSGEAFLTAIKRAIDTYKKADDWSALVKNAMNKDFSWQRSAREYMELYHKLTH